MRTNKVKTVALIATTVLAGACSSGSSTPQAVASSAGAGATTAPAGSAAPSSGSSDSAAPAASSAAPPASSAKTLTADALQKALLTAADAPGYRVAPLQGTTKPSASAPPSRDCAKIFGSVGSLTADKGKGVSADESLEGSGGTKQAATMMVRLQASPTPDDAGAAVADLRQGLAGCKVVTAVPVTGVGDDAAAFTMNLGDTMAGGIGFLTARVGTVTVTIELVGAGAAGSGLPELTAQLKEVAAKQAAKVKTAEAG